MNKFQLYQIKCSLEKEKSAERLKEMYNSFVDAIGDRLISSLKINIGKSKLNGEVALFFDVETDLGFYKYEAIQIFSHFISKYPECGIDYNLREDDELTKALKKASETTIELWNGFRMEKI